MNHASDRVIETGYLNLANILVKTFGFASLAQLFMRIYVVHKYTFIIYVVMCIYYTKELYNDLVQSLNNLFID